MLISKYANVVPRVEAEVLLSHALKCSRVELYVNEACLDTGTEGLCSSLISRRLAGEPIQYITGSTEFMGLDFMVNKDVFIPRPETEVLVNEVLRIANHERRTTNGALKVLDLCTGCGNIAVSLARALPQSEIIATDITEVALAIAEKNSITHGVDKNITFYKGDLFEALPFDKRYKFDIIVCNPPYIKSSELQILQEEVRREPKVALDGGIDGLEFYRHIAGSAKDWLTSKGTIFLEIGFGQAQDVKDIFASKKLFKIEKVRKDFAGLDRVIWISLS